MDTIEIRGARTHNLRNVDLTLPRDRLIVITGLSGSGKSSLAFDTIYAEGQRRYVESLSAYARQFLSMMEKPDIDSIEGLSPAISIEQKSTSHNPRSTVGTVTEIYDYLRLLYARTGIPSCPDHGGELIAQTVSQMVDKTLEHEEGSAWMLLAPVVDGRKGEHKQIIEQLRSQGFIRARIDGTVVELDEAPELNKKTKHTIEAVVDRFKIREDLKQRLAESFETALNLADGVATLAPYNREGESITFSSRYACKVCGWAIGELEPRLFSFNNPTGACPTCDGLGQMQVFDQERVVAHPDVPLGDGYLLQELGDRFTLLTIDADAPDEIVEDGVTVTRLALSVKDDPTLALKERYLGDAESGVYLIRPDQHIAARRATYDDNLFRAAIRRATGKE